MRWIPPGRFLMGSPDDDEMALDREKPRHEVTLSHGYWLFDTPVTQELWLAVMKENPSRFQAPLRPVECLSWDDCQAFLDKINEAVAGLRLSLPTEAEWEYGCRAGTMSRYAFGEEISPDQANYYGGPPWGETSPVGSFAANPWGLFDMHGNVLEWCEDRSGAYAADAQLNPQGPSDGYHRVLRGGSWGLSAQYVRSAVRSHAGLRDRGRKFGFRCARVHPSSRQRERTSDEAGQSRDATPGRSE
ncbi:MAG: formylglycine-generating enzyme family protein [Planctomycetes bacterium]|nr:formylglycine-generating enzyme family protein [Planctomycetota bacterium]